MIVITRRRDEAIIIGDDIIVSVVEIRDDRVRLGVQAPLEIGVHRHEVYEAIRSQTDLPTTMPSVESTMPAIESMAPQPTTIALADRHVALLDRLRSTIGGRGGIAPSREEALGAILDAFETAQASVAEATLLAHLEGNLDEDRRSGG
jgi:carbon storage regulator